mgnify:CR=1 FL=1
MKIWSRISVLAGVAIAWFAVSQAIGQSPATATSSAPASAGISIPEIEQLDRQYEQAFNRGDASSLGAMFTQDVQYTDEDGVLVQGRAAIQDLLKKQFSASPGATMAIQVESLKPLAADVAVERGNTTTTARNGEKSSSAYTAIFTRQGGAWRISQLIESPLPVTSPAEQLLNWAGWWARGVTRTAAARKWKPRCSGRVAAVS